MASMFPAVDKQGTEPKWGETSGNTKPTGAGPRSAPQSQLSQSSSNQPITRAIWRGGHCPSLAPSCFCGKSGAENGHVRQAPIPPRHTHTHARACTHMHMHAHVHTHTIPMHGSPASPGKQGLQDRERMQSGGSGGRDGASPAMKVLSAVLCAALHCEGRGDLSGCAQARPHLSFSCSAPLVGCP